ncbi:MAG TPA: class I tRNA ligase family protein [Candidatus Dormibacteraeota bacterium]|nr:class I tRNA ligase family protein [Candidatus Dormibacteraeota bacterium]
MPRSRPHARSTKALRVHDTLSRRAVRFAPARRPLTLYVCGVTPYDSGHMGHAFTFSIFDVLVRFLESQGQRVKYVQNVTDVDDPLFERAKRDGVDWRELADRETKVHLRDMTTLGWRAPDVMPQVSDEIPDIVAATNKLHSRGCAYQTDALYFEADRYPSYGRLSHRSRRSMLAKLRDEGLLGHVGPDGKRDALDFPLWRRSGEGEPAWPSKFGDGRPGWHIECSVMAMRYLGPQIDIHGGGRDLQFSHHESERAQSESLTGKRPFARAWMHTGMVRYGGRKMSKSLGNLVKVSQALQRAPAAAVRLYLVSHRYARDWSFDWAGLARNARLMERIRKFLADSERSGKTESPPDRSLMAEFNAALSDDLDTPRAVRALRSALAQRDPAAVRAMLAILVGTASLS